MNLKQVFSGLFAAAMMFGATAVAQDVAEEKNEWMPEFSFSAKYASRYLSKGKVVNPESMTIYDASLSLQGFYAGIWIANDQNDYNRESGIDYEPEEIDYYIGYGYTFEEIPVVNSISLDVCYTYFDYPSRAYDHNVPGKREYWTDGQTDEYALSVNFGLMFAPGFKVCWDPEHEIWYGNLNASWDYNFKEEGLEALTFSTSVEAWWGNNNFFSGKDEHDNDIAWTTLCWNTSLDYQVCENVTFGPFATLAWAIDPAYRKSWKDNDNAKSGCNTLWGVKLAFSF